MKARPSTPRGGKLIRILIADREEVFRIGLQGLFGAEDDLQVVAQAEDNVQVARLAGQFKPDLLFVQAEIAAEGLGDLLAEVRHALPSSKIVITEQRQYESFHPGVLGLASVNASPAPVN